MDSLLKGHRTMLLLLWIIPEVLGYDCIEKCDSYGRVVAPDYGEDKCLISMPDNPIKKENSIQPCQLVIMSNCTDFCHVELNFAKFNLPECRQNVSHYTDACEHVDSCEYVVLQEMGTDDEGVPSSYTTTFHGHKTKQKYVSFTDKVRLRFCYRSETFSSRNIQVEYRAMIPDSAKPIYYGPPSVYVMSSFVVIFMLGIVVVQWCPLLRPCLDPPSEEKPSLSSNV